jgi:CheY-like chemotaxis protein
VLVVEDEEQVLVLAKSYLEEQGHKALSADTIDGALAILGGDEPVDVLFTDIGLHEVKDAGLELPSRRSSDSRASRCCTRRARR